MLTSQVPHLVAGGLAAHLLVVIWETSIRRLSVPHIQEEQEDAYEYRATLVEAVSTLGGMELLCWGIGTLASSSSIRSS